MTKLSLAKPGHRTVEHSTVLDGKRYAFWGIVWDKIHCDI